MPATAGRVRMPANNRVHSSAALQTHGIWQSAIGYDPYAPNKDEKSQVSKPSNSEEPDAENAYASFQGLLALARITGSNADEVRGSCKKCGRVGHLTYSCRNFLSIKEDKDKESSLHDLPTLDKLQPNHASGRKEGSDESSEEESETTDSDVDSEIERIIAARSGKKLSNKVKSSTKKYSSSKRPLTDDEASDSSGRRKRGRSRRRKSRKDADDDSDEGSKKKKKDTMRKRRHGDDDVVHDKHRRHHRKSRKEKKRRRSRYSDDSDESEESDRDCKRKGRRAPSGSNADDSSSDDSRNDRRARHSKEKCHRHRHRE